MSNHGNMDLQAFDSVGQSEGGIWFKPLAPDGGPFGDPTNPFRVLVMGCDSRRYQQIQERRTGAAARAMLALKDKAASDTEPSPGEREAEAVAEFTLGWEGAIWNGKPLEFNPANARMLYYRVPIVREQVSRFASDREHFFGKPSGS